MPAPLHCLAIPSIATVHPLRQDPQTSPVGDSGLFHSLRIRAIKFFVCPSERPSSLKSFSSKTMSAMSRDPAACVCISVCAHVSFQDTSWCSRMLPYSVALLCCPVVFSPGLSLPERKRCETTQRTGTKAQEHQERHKSIKTATKPLRQQGSRVVYICTTSYCTYIYTDLQALNNGLKNSLNNGLNNSIKAPGLLAQSRQTQTVIHGLGQQDD